MIKEGEEEEEEEEEEKEKEEKLEEAFSCDTTEVKVVVDKQI